MAAERSSMSSPLWNKCLDHLESELGAQQFNTWIRPLQIIEGEQELELLAPNQYVLEWVNEHLLERVQHFMHHISDGAAPRITVRIGTQRREEPSDTAIATPAPSTRRHAGGGERGLCLQPPVHLRGGGAGQDPPDACGRQSDSGTFTSVPRGLSAFRGVRRGDDQGAATQPDRRLPSMPCSSTTSSSSLARSGHRRNFSILSMRYWKVSSRSCSPVIATPRSWTGWKSG